VVRGGTDLCGLCLGGGEKGSLGGEQVVEEDLVHLLWGLGPGEGREAPLGSTIGKPLGRPQALGGGGQQKRGPVFVFGGLDCLEISQLGGAGNFPHAWAVSFPGRSSGLVVSATEDGQVRGAPGF